MTTPGAVGIDATRRLRSLIRRVAHSVRHAVALRQLSALGLPRSVLFVCQGNIYRSPFAAGLFSRRLPSAVRNGMSIRSAGFEAPGRRCPDAAITLAAASDIDLGEHRSSFVSAELVRASELIVVVDPRHQEALSRRFRLPAGRIILLPDLSPTPLPVRAIPDPVGQEPEVLGESYRCIDECVRVMIDRMVAGRG
jgi:protein-tyrosine phosphatase